MNQEVGEEETPEDELMEFNYEKARELKDALDHLEASPGWRFVLDFIAVRVKGRKRQLYEMVPNNTETMVEFARLKGSIEELELLPKILKQLREDLAADIYAAQEQQAAEEEMKQSKE